ncbi:hypothetical protein [Mesorhizobium sp. B261B1A]|uniref:hypothetical protein n=1 Tax=Mesorhizobium sp. B261B1A TaxID=2876671 RepID=UPI001CD11946|nr:hypothetical protein [Mesorhizobium sp. B261B1A]MCA0057124.1 hypothetical protein [Mesorhizobium sp. B261B1A]
MTIIGQWDALTIQMVWFTGDARRHSAATLFSQLLGIEPDAYQSNKSISAPVPFLSSASGVVDDLSYNLNVQPSRVDLLLQREAPPDQQPATIADPEVRLGKLIAMSQSLSNLLTSVNRLALVTTLIQPAESHAAANKVAAEMIGIELPRYDVTEFSLQLNSRVPFDDGSKTQLNRFLKFGVVSFHSVFFEVGSPVMTPQSVQQFGASLSIDVNSVPVLEPLDPATQSDMWNALASETIRLREIGNLGGLFDA